MVKRHWTLAEIVDQLQACGYTCEAGPLEGSVAFHALAEKAREELIEQAAEAFESIYNVLDSIAEGGDVAEAIETHMRPFADKYAPKGGDETMPQLRVRLREDPYLSYGTWWLPEGAQKPYMVCPECGGTLLGDDAPHAIDDNGDVNASVVCRHPGCTFHQFVTLWGWKCDCHFQPPYGFVVMGGCPYHD